MPFKCCFWGPKCLSLHLLFVCDSDCLAVRVGEWAGASGDDGATHESVERGHGHV